MKQQTRKLLITFDSAYYLRTWENLKDQAQPSRVEEFMCISLEEAGVSLDLFAFFASAAAQEKAGMMTFHQGLCNFRSVVFSPAEFA